MSTLRDIWTKAILANQELALNRQKGEAKFRRLIELYPNDGMVYYERGEAYEYLKEFDLAESDYKAAEKLFFIEHWKAIAREGLTRIQYKRQPSPVLPELAGDTLPAIHHRIHLVPQIPHDIRVDALSALVKFGSEPQIAAAQLRSCLEQLVANLLDSLYIDYSDMPELEQQTALLKSLGIIPAPIADKMDLVRRLGNRGIHKTKRGKPVNFSPSASAFTDIMEWLGENQQRKKQSL